MAIEATIMGTWKQAEIDGVLTNYPSFMDTMTSRILSVEDITGLESESLVDDTLSVWRVTVEEEDDLYDFSDTSDIVVLKAHDQEDEEKQDIVLEEDKKTQASRLMDFGIPELAIEELVSDSEKLVESFNDYIKEFPAADRPEKKSVENVKEVQKDESLTGRVRSLLWPDQKP